MTKTLPTPPPAVATITNVEAKGPNMGKDRHGLTFDECRAIQARQLKWWETLLKPEHYKKLEAFCERTNKPCTIGEQWPNGVHHVARGVEIEHFLEDRAKFLLDDEGENETWLHSHIVPHSNTQSK